jgi:RND family efflux transporter MFP subunit
MTPDADKGRLACTMTTPQSRDPASLRATFYSWNVVLLLGLVGVQPAAAGDMPCLIVPYMEVSVGAPVEGLLETVAVDRGDLVKQGQVLATLESTVEQATVAVAKAKAEQEAERRTSLVKEEFSTRKLVRVTDLAKSNSIAQHEVDEAKTEKSLAEIARVEATENHRLAELDLSRAQAALSQRTIRSPITGVVVERLQHPGELVKQAPILKLAQIDPLRVEIFAPLAMLGQVKVGSTAEIKPSSPPGGTYNARVTIVNQVMDSASATFGIRLELPNHDYRLPAGLQCSVRFSTTRK